MHRRASLESGSPNQSMSQRQRQLSPMKCRYKAAAAKSIWAGVEVVMTVVSAIRMTHGRIAII